MVPSLEVDNYLDNYQSNHQVEPPRISQAAQPGQLVPSTRGTVVMVRPSQLNPGRLSSNVQDAEADQAGRKSRSPSQTAEPRYYFNPNYAEDRSGTPDDNRVRGQSGLANADSQDARQSQSAYQPQPSINRSPTDSGQVVEQSYVDPVTGRVSKYSFVQPARVSNLESSTVRKSEAGDQQTPTPRATSGSRFGTVPGQFDNARGSNISFGQPEPADRQSIMNQSQASDSQPIDDPNGPPSFRPSQNQSPFVNPADPRASANQARISQNSQPGFGPRPTIDDSKKSKYSIYPLFDELDIAGRQTRGPSGIVNPDFYKSVKVEDILADVPLPENTEKSLAIVNQFIEQNGLASVVEHVIYNKEDDEFVVKYVDPQAGPPTDRRSTNRQGSVVQPSPRESMQKFKIVPLFKLDPSRADAVVENGGLSSEAVSVEERHTSERV